MRVEAIQAQTVQPIAYRPVRDLRDQTAPVRIAREKREAQTALPTEGYKTTLAQSAQAAQTAQAAAQSAQAQISVPEDNKALASWLAEVSMDMAAAAPQANSTAATGNNLADLYRFHNQYYYGTSSQTWARIDSDTDGFWDRSELTAYADAYEQATGRALDVDALLSKYGDASERIGYAGQQSMYADDALGIRYAKDALTIAEYNASTGQGSGKINDAALDRFVERYTYGTSNKLYAKIDANDDGVWTLDELSSYAKAYEQATGVKLDIEALMAKYDVDGDGVIKYAEQNAMYNDDALGLSRISEALNARETGTVKEQGSIKDKPDTSLRDSIQSKFTRKEISQLASAFTESIQKSALLDAFTMTNLFINNRNTVYLGGTYTLWNISNLAVLSMFR